MRRVTRQSDQCRVPWGRLSLAELVSCRRGLGAANEEAGRRCAHESLLPPTTPALPSPTSPTAPVCPGFLGISVSSDHLSWWLRW